MPIENVIDTTDNCRNSLMCRHMCPVGNITYIETLTPHGWAQLIASERRGLITWNADTVDALYKCADCGSCRSHCVTDQPLPAAIAAARALVADRGLAPTSVKDVARRLEEWENPFREESPGTPSGSGDFALFVGDTCEHLRPRTVEAVLKLLDALDIRPALVGRGRNNGYLASALGLPEIATRLADNTRDEISSTGARRLLVLTPGDYFAIRHMWDERLGVVLPEDLEILELTSFLHQQAESGAFSVGRLANGIPYAYVDPTHSVRKKDGYEAPRALLAALYGSPPLELFWRKERAYPTGNLGLQFTHPDLADELTRARLEDARQVGARRIVTTDPGDLFHLSRFGEAFGIEVVGLYELLAERLVAE